MIPTLSWQTIIAFAALTLSLACLWTLRAFASPRTAQLWMLPFALSLAAGTISGLVDLNGLLFLLFFAGACRAARQAGGPAVRGVSLAIVLAASAALLTHVVNGFENPRVLTGVVLGPGSERYTKYLNFDKGVAGLFLLGLYAPELPARDSGFRRLPGILWRLAVMTAVLMALALALGFVRWDPKAPSWWPLWTWSMVCLTALPEEALFRGVVQTGIARRLEGTSHAAAIAMVLAGVLFGLAHIGGGPVYVVLASVAGVGYGWIYSSTGSIGAAILAHTGLNVIHFLLFSYPSLRLAAA